jgi:hypothetical protein
MYEPFLAIIDGHDVCFAPFNRDTTRDRFGDSNAPLEPQYGVVVVDPVTAYVYEWYFLAALWEPSDRVFSARSDRPPIEFVDVRELIRAVDPLLREDAVVTVTVEGRRVSSGRHDRFSGRITSVRTDTSESPDGEPTRSLLTREAEIVVKTEDSTVTVGGEGCSERRRRGRSGHHHRHRRTDRVAPTPVEPFSGRRETPCWIQRMGLV